MGERMTVTMRQTSRKKCNAGALTAPSKCFNGARKVQELMKSIFHRLSTQLRGSKSWQQAICSLCVHFTPCVSTICAYLLSCSVIMCVEKAKDSRRGSRGGGGERSGCRVKVKKQLINMQVETFHESYNMIFCAKNLSTTRRFRVWNLVAI